LEVKRESQPFFAQKWCLGGEIQLRNFPKILGVYPRKSGQDMAGPFFLRPEAGRLLISVGQSAALEMPSRVPVRR
jgi:hypothetical protein